MSSQKGGTHPDVFLPSPIPLTRKVTPSMADVLRTILDLLTLRYFLSGNGGNHRKTLWDL